MSVFKPRVLTEQKQLAAVWIQSCEFRTSKEYKSLRQPPMPVYPISNRHRIRRGEQARRIRRGKFPTFPIHQHGGMEAQNGLRRDTNPIFGNLTQHEGAGREARPVDDDPFAGVLESLKEVEERHHIAARTCEDPHVGQCGRQADEKKSSSYYRAPHRHLPMVAVERGPRRRGSMQVYLHSMCEASLGPLGCS
jgi:hypothetical protein